MTINGIAASPGTDGVSVKKTDVIVVKNNSTAPVTFTLIDKQFYLVPDSIDGSLFGSAAVTDDQDILIGTAKFAQLSSSITLGGGLSFVNSSTHKDVPKTGDTSAAEYQLPILFAALALLVVMLLISSRKGVKSPKN